MARFGVEMTLRKSKMLAAEEKRLGHSMRCEGCAAKVEGDSLNQALDDISVRPLGDAALARQQPLGAERRCHQQSCG